MKAQEEENGGYIPPNIRLDFLIKYQVDNGETSNDAKRVYVQAQVYLHLKQAAHIHLDDCFCCFMNVF